MRIVVIGAGRMGVIRAEDLANDGRVDEIVISNRSPERAQALAARVGGTTCPWGEWPDADGYVVTTATDTHVELLEQVATFGTPLLVEKPLAMTVEETDHLIAITEGVTTQIGFQRHFDAGIAAIKQAIDAGDLGVLYTMTLTSHDMTPGSPDYIAGSGGTFRDMLVHDLELVCWLTGSPIATVYATGAVRAHHDYAAADDFDVVLVHVVTESGVQVAISGTRHDARGHDIRLEAFGSLDSVTAGLNHRTPLRPLDGEPGIDVDPYQGFMDRFRPAFAAETSAFVDVVLGERINPCTPQASREALRAAIACEVSAREGRVVRLEEI